MTLREYLEGRVTDGTARTLSEAAANLAARSGVSTVTIKNVANGMQMKRADKARALADATDGLVSTEELTG